MKLTISTADLGKKLLLALWMFIIYIRMGAEFFIGNIASYATPLLTSTMVLSGLFCLVNINYALLRHNLRYILLFVLSLAVMLPNNYDFKNDSYYNIFFFMTMYTMFLVFSNIEVERWAEALIKFMIFVGLFYSFWTVATYFSSDIFYSIYGVLGAYAKADILAYYKSGYMSGLTVHWTANGIYISLGFVASACSFFFKDNTKRMKRVYAVFTVFLLFALLLSAKRAHLLFSLVALLVTYYLYGVNRAFSRFFKIIFLFALALLVFYIVSMFVPGVLNALNRSAEFMENDDISNGRGQLQEEAYAFMQKNLFTGNGWEFFTYNNMTMPGQHAHNVYLQLLCDVGIVGFSVFIAIFALMLLKSVAKLVKSRRRKLGCIGTKKEEWILCSSICYQLFFLLYCTTGNPLYDKNCFFPYIMLSAAAISVVHRLEKGRRSI